MLHPRRTTSTSKFKLGALRDLSAPCACPRKGSPSQFRQPPMVIIPQTNCQVQEPANQKKKRKIKIVGLEGYLLQLWPFTLSSQVCVAKCEFSGRERRSTVLKAPHTRFKNLYILINHEISHTYTKALDKWLSQKWRLLVRDFNS